MNLNRKMKRIIAVVLTVTVTWMSAAPASAALAPARTASAAAMAARTADLNTVRAFLEQKQVSERLAGFGLSQAEVQARLDNLTDQEVHHVATQIEQQNPAGDGGGVLVTVLVIGILVLLFVYLLKRV